VAMTTEVFDDKQARNKRFNDLRAAGVKHVNRYSSIRQLQHPEDGRTIWRDCWNLCYPTKVDGTTVVPHFGQLAAENTVESAKAQQSNDNSSAVVAAFDQLLEEVKPDASGIEIDSHSGEVTQESTSVVSAGANEVSAVEQVSA
jgi:hypothetical protein